MYLIGLYYAGPKWRYLTYNEGRRWNHNRTPVMVISIGEGLDIIFFVFLLFSLKRHIIEKGKTYIFCISTRPARKMGRPGIR